MKRSDFINSYYWAQWLRDHPQDVPKTLVEKLADQAERANKAEDDLREALDALKHMVAAANEKRCGLKCAEDVLVKHNYK